MRVYYGFIKVFLFLFDGSCSFDDRCVFSIPLSVYSEQQQKKCCERGAVVVVVVVERIGVVEKLAK